MEIQRHNTFELIGKGSNLYHSAILTSFTFDPIYFESFYLPRLRQCGVCNVVVLLDASNYDRVLSLYPSFGIESDRRQYSLIRISPSGNGVFHPKISMFLGEESGMLIVGSGNLTYNGQGLNEEIWNVFSLKGTESVYLPLFNSAWQYLKSLRLPQSVLLAQQMRWMGENTHWLTTLPEIDNEIVTIDNEHYFLLTNESGRTIFNQIEEIIDGEQVDSFTVVSPFYDASGLTIKALYDAFSPNEVHCVYSESGIPPYKLAQSTPHWLHLYSWEDVFKAERSDVHRLHAKLLQFNLPSRTVFISGSANATNAALNGANDEACIAIVSAEPKDFVKDLGITLSRTAMADKTKLGRLTMPETTKPITAPKGLQILSAEVVDATLTIVTNYSVNVDYRLKVLDTTGKTLQVIDIPDESDYIQFRNFTHRNCIATLIDSNDDEASNRCFILNDEDITRFNPNKLLRKLESLLESNKDWRDNLEGILSYLWFDDNKEIGNGSRSQNKSIRTQSTEGKTVSSEDFDNIRIGARHTVLSLPEVRILDALLSSERLKKDTVSPQGSDDMDLVDDIDNGDNDYHHNESQTQQRYYEVSFHNSRSNYSRRLRKHYDLRLQQLYDTGDKYGTDIFKAIPSDVGPTDYSRILIDVVLIWKEIAQNSNKNRMTTHDDFIKNLGKFLVFARKGYGNTNDYAQLKCIEYHRELIVYSLLIIASQNWLKRETTAIKLLVANLLHTCTVTGAIDIDEIDEVFKKKADEFGLAHIQTSLELIDETMSEYSIFALHLQSNDYTMVREVDFHNPRGNYSFRNGFGFFDVVSIEVKYQKTINQTNYVLELNHPGLDKSIFIVKGSRKIRSLN